MHLEIAKDMWDKRTSSYEGNKKVKDAKLQTYKVQFELLQMKEDETIGKYFLRVEDTTTYGWIIPRKFSTLPLVSSIF